MKMFTRTSLLIVILALCACAAAQTSENSPPADNPLSDAEIVAALKQTLELSTDKAIALTGRSDGFLNNEAIRILLPTKLQSLGKSMRLLGEGDTVDDLEIGMNRAAERATPQAKQIFHDALKNLVLRNPHQMLNGRANAAAEYFQQTCSADLTANFTPIIHAVLQRMGVSKKYDHVVKTAPGGDAIANEFDLDKYVTGKTLDGIFYMIGQEEIKIRTTPSAQTTPLLKEVFGKK